jgi:hypothetical protein
MIIIGLTQTTNKIKNFMPLRHKDSKFHKDFLVLLCDFVTLWQSNKYQHNLYINKF